VSIDWVIAPLRTNWLTIDCATMFGEMYVFVASRTIFAMSSAGPTR
jgi:hypothetical protein